MRNKLALFVYCLICNIPVCLALCVAAAFLGVRTIDNGVVIINLNQINWGNVFLNFAVGMAIATIVGNFVHLGNIGRWFTALFKVPNVTYEGNMKYRLLATLIITLIYFIFISPSLTLFNYFVLKIFDSPQDAILSFFINMPTMLIVGFVTSLIFDLPAYQVAHKIDNNF